MRYSLLFSRKKVENIPILLVRNKKFGIFSCYDFILGTK